MTYIIRPQVRPLYFRVFDGLGTLVLESAFAREAKQRAGKNAGWYVEDSDGNPVHISARFRPVNKCDDCAAGIRHVHNA